MIVTNLKIAFRQLRKQKLYAIVKIGGFAIGIAACMLIGLYIRNEASFDRSYPDAGRIYRLVGIFNNQGKTEKGTSWPAPMTKALVSGFPEIERAGRLMNNSLIGEAGSNQLRRADQAENTYEEGFTYVDQDLLDILELPLVFGNRQVALKEPYSLVISESKAKLYFPGQDPVGKRMVIDGDVAHPYIVGGVMADFPETSHLRPYHFLLSLSGREFWPGEQTDWGTNNYPGYVLLRPGTNVTRLEQKLFTGIMNSYYLPMLRKAGVKDAEKLVANFRFHLQPVHDINLHSADINDGLSHGDIRFTWLFGAVAVFILVVACINFINLSTARSANRAKEIGLRKLVGSHRGALIRQFLTESLVYSGLSFTAGILLSIVLLPYFNSLAGKTLSMPWTEWWFIPAILAATVLIGFAAGLYPAIYLSGFKPARVLKGDLSLGSKSPVLRNGLVVFQFAVSTVLMVSTMVIYSQMRFMLHRKAGFDKDQVLVLQGTNTLGEGLEGFKNELLRLSTVKNVSVSDYLPVSGTKRNGNTFWQEGRAQLDAGVIGQFWQADERYLETLGMDLVAGRNFSKELASDHKALIINETMAKQLGLSNAVGERITNGEVFTVIGVVRDFNFESMRGNIGPLALHFAESPSMISVKIGGSGVTSALAGITALWKRYAPGQPIRYSFLDERFAAMYADVHRTGRIFTAFAVLAIFIACLGLFALSAFMAEQRSKEIGIRKVLGATATGIVGLLSVDFARLVALAVLIATPIAWWGMNRWLQDFAYRTPVSWWMFLATGLASLVIALLTVSFQSVKAAWTNPVKSMRND